MSKWVVFSIVEPRTKKILYIDYVKEGYNSDRDYIVAALYKMKKDKNEYSNDLNRIYISDYYNELVAVVLMESNKKSDAKYSKEEYIKMFRPRYNIEKVEEYIYYNGV